VVSGGHEQRVVTGGHEPECGHESECSLRLIVCRIRLFLFFWRIRIGFDFINQTGIIL